MTLNPTPTDPRIVALLSLPEISGGASRFGVHFIGSWMACPRRAALSTLMPHPEGGIGLTPYYTDRPLGIGWTYHEGIAAWYASRCTNPSTGNIAEDTGKPDLEFALTQVDVQANTRKAEWEDIEEWKADVELCKNLVTRYHRWYGPGGVDPEYPSVRVYVDDTGPWVERTIEVPIGDTGLLFTCRPDLIATHLGTICVWEHKTSAASAIRTLRGRMHVDGQPTGELFALAHAHPNLARHVAAVTINIINKNPAKSGRGTTPEFARERVSRTPEDLQWFAYEVETNLLAIGDMVLRWQAHQADGMDAWQAMKLAFPKHGTITGHCTSHNRLCQFANICQSSGREQGLALSFRPRIRHAEPDESTDPIEHTDPVGLTTTQKGTL